MKEKSHIIIRPGFGILEMAGINGRMEVFVMRQKSELNYPEVISMEEYLTKRQKIREHSAKRKPKEMQKGSPAWLLAELYV